MHFIRLMYRASNHVVYYNTNHLNVQLNFVSMESRFLVVPLLLHFLVHRVRGYLEGRLWRVSISSSDAFVFRVLVLSFDMSVCARMTYHEYFRSFRLALVWGGVDSIQGLEDSVSFFFFLITERHCPYRDVCCSTVCKLYRCAEANTWGQMKKNVCRWE